MEDEEFSDKPSFLRRRRKATVSKSAHETERLEDHEVNIPTTTPTKRTPGTSTYPVIPPLRPSVAPELEENLPSKKGFRLSVPLCISLLSLVISLIALFFAMTGSHGLTEEQKGELLSLADDVRGIKNDMIEFSVPMTTKLHLAGSIPAADVFADGNTVKVPVYLRINQPVTVIDPRTGVPVKMIVNDTIVTNATVDLDFSKSVDTLKVDNDVQVSAVTKGTLKLSQLEERLDQIAERIERVAR